MDFIFCEAKGQRISRAVCQKNLERGTCKQDLLKCHQAKKAKAREPEKVKPKWERRTKMVSDDANCGPLFAGLDNKGD